jgi:hypothetical protein
VHQYHTIDYQRIEISTLPPRAYLPLIRRGD